MNDADPVPPPDPAPPADPVPPPQAAKDDGRAETGWRLLFNGLAIVMSGITFAPVGIFVDTGLINYVPDNGETALMIIYWACFLGLAGYAALTRNKPRGQVLTFLVFGLALLNLHGCVAGLIGIGKATGG